MTEPTPQTLGPQCDRNITLTNIGNNKGHYNYHCIMYSMTDTVTRLPYSVIMVESSNTSRLLPRQACAVESAVRLQRIYSWRH